MLFVYGEQWRLDCSQPDVFVRAVKLRESDVPVEHCVTALDSLAGWRFVTFHASQ